MRVNSIIDGAFDLDALSREDEQRHRWKLRRILGTQSDRSVQPGSDDPTPTIIFISMIRSAPLRSRLIDMAKVSGGALCRDRGLH
jgi:hypothetical protein